MLVWLRLTALFGPPEDTAEIDDIICASIGPILRADADDLVRAPLPRQLAGLLHQLARREHDLLAAPRTKRAYLTAPGLAVTFSAPRNGAATALITAPPTLLTTDASDPLREATAAS